MVLNLIKAFCSGGHCLIKLVLLVTGQMLFWEAEYSSGSSHTRLESEVQCSEQRDEALSLLLATSHLQGISSGS